jgi:hypothetical protein
MNKDSPCNKKQYKSVRQKEEISISILAPEVTPIMCQVDQRQTTQKTHLHFYVNTD